MFARVAVWKPRAAISAKSQEIGWNDEPRPAPEGETFYRVIRHG